MGVGGPGIRTGSVTRVYGRRVLGSDGRYVNPRPAEAPPVAAAVGVLGLESCGDSPADHVMRREVRSVPGGVITSACLACGALINRFNGQRREWIERATPRPGAGAVAPEPEPAQIRPSEARAVGVCGPGRAGHPRQHRVGLKVNGRYDGTFRCEWCGAVEHPAEPLGSALPAPGPRSPEAACDVCPPGITCAVRIAAKRTEE